MKKCNCECCGAPLPIPKTFDKYIKCSYCGATYEIENNKQVQDISLSELKYILVEPGYLQKYAAKIIVDEEQIRYYPPEIMEKYIREQLANKLVDFLMDKINIKESYDIKNFARVYQTVIRLDTRTY